MSLERSSRGESLNPFALLPLAIPREMPDREPLLDLEAQLAALGERGLVLDQVAETLDEVRQRFAGEIRMLAVFVLLNFLPSAGLAWLGHRGRLEPSGRRV